VGVRFESLRRFDASSATRVKANDQPTSSPASLSSAVRSTSRAQQSFSKARSPSMELGEATIFVRRGQGDVKMRRVNESTPERR
jgi:hypothetical protein